MTTLICIVGALAAGAAAGTFIAALCVASGDGDRSRALALQSYREGYDAGRFDAEREHALERLP